MADQRQITIITPLGDDLLIKSMHGVEQLGRLFEFELELLSQDASINIDSLLGEPVTVCLQLDGEQQRYFHGVISHFSQLGHTEGRYIVYQATVHPWLWFLTRTADCRIFQEMTVPDIIQQIFGDHGFSDFRTALSGEYREWEYCVQYRETDFNFVSRLMEQEGIYYFFEHEKDKHTLVMADDYSSHQAISGYEKIPYYPPGQHVSNQEEHVSEWNIEREVQSGGYKLNDFNFKQPGASLHTQDYIQRDHAGADFEIYDYPGEYTEQAEGKQYALARIEELQVRYEQLSGRSDARGLIPGGLFSLYDYPRDDQNREYLVTAASYELDAGAYVSGDASGQAFFQCRFSSIESKTPYRSARTTPKPTVQGPQTAIVVGPAGEEIHPDEFGRVKLQFHWDRYGQADENSSCWVRVSQAWAGKNWGAMHIPRIGQEVIVQFLEGDPDRPIITGHVYNADQMPPYDLPANKTQSGLCSRSSKGGAPDNFNEIRFEDKIGEEELHLQAEKNHTQLTKNDRTETVGNDRSLEVGNDRTESIGNDNSQTVGNNKTITVGTDHTETIGSNKSLTVGADHSENVGSNMTITIGSNLTETVAMNYAETVGIAMELTVGALMAETVGANKEQNVAVNKSISIGKDKSENVGANKTVSVGKDQKVDVGKTLTYEVKDQITIKTGKASITMKKDGTITIKGKDISLDGSGEINAKASKDIVLKGKKILEN